VVRRWLEGDAINLESGVCVHTTVKLANTKAQLWDHTAPTEERACDQRLRKTVGAVRAAGSRQPHEPRDARWIQPVV